MKIDIGLLEQKISAFFCIRSNYLPLHGVPAGTNISTLRDVAFQINPDGLGNFAGAMNIWGEVYRKRSLETTNNFSIKATTQNDEANIAIFGGSSLNNYWIIGRNSFNVGTYNLVFGNNTRAIVMQLNQNGDITIPKQITVGENAYITTLQVNANSYLVGDVFLTSNNVNINDIYSKKTIYTRYGRY